MSFSGPRKLWLVALVSLGIGAAASAQTSTPSSAHSSSSSSATHAHKPAADSSGIDAGVVVNGVYRNKALGLSYKIPEGWVLRTEEMNSGEAATEENSGAAGSQGSPKQREPSTGSGQAAGHPSAEAGARVLLAAFSRPPEARGEDVNGSVVMAAESTEAYPGLKEAAQYFGPLTEVATAQGFAADEEPYEYEVGTKKLVRGDFHKDVGSRVMRQSTLVWLARGYTVSITVIGGTEDEVESLIDRVTFGK